MVINKWRYAIKLQTALELFTMFPIVTIPAIARSLHVEYSWLYREFGKLGVLTRDVRLGWHKVSRGNYASPCGRFKARKRAHRRWVLYRDGGPVKVLESFKACVGDSGDG